MASATHTEPRLRPLPFRGPLSVLGAVAGMIAAGIVVPGCVFSESQAERLHVTMPVAMPIALLLAAMWIGRRLGPPVSRRRWILLALAMTLAAEALFNLVTAIAYEPGRFFEHWLAAFAIFAPMLVGLFPAVLLIVAAAREVVGLRLGSVAAAVAHRQVWIFTLGSLAPLAAIMWTLQDGKRLSAPAPVAWWLSAGAILVMVALLAVDVHAARRIARLLPEGRARASGEPVGASARRIDLGVGDEAYVPEPARAYRAPAAAQLLVLGEPEAALRFIASARNRAMLAIVVAGVSAAIAWLDLTRVPPPEPAPKVPDFVWDRCEISPGSGASRADG